MNSREKIIHYLKNKTSSQKIIWSGFFILAVLHFLISKPTPEHKPPEPETPLSADTFIPAGSTLVPVEIVNGTTLNSLLGAHGGVVDLYLPREQGALKVASKVKLFRAPLNPEAYSVLVKDLDSPQILKHQGPFVAVVKNPRETGAHLFETQKSKIRIDYQN